MTGVHQGQAVLKAGKPLDEAQGVMIAIHGRGASAQSILELAAAFDQPDWGYFAPQASNFTWYPYSFLAPIENNEPGLSSGLQAIDDIVKHINAQGVATEHIMLMGFSQGACLAAEYVARHAQRFAGLAVLSGGVIGPDGTPRNYAGSLENTPVFIGCSDVDAHIPLARVHETTQVLKKLGGNVDERIYPGMPHTVNDDEINAVKALMQNATS